MADLYTTRLAAWTPSLCLRGLFLAALHHSQNQCNRFELHVSAWYCFAPMGPTLCTRLDDPSGSRPAHSWPQGTTFSSARPQLRQVRLQYHRRLAGLPQPLGCCHGAETLRSSLDDPSGAWRKIKSAPRAWALGAAKSHGRTQNVHSEITCRETRTNVSFMTA